MTISVKLLLYKYKNITKTPVSLYIPTKQTRKVLKATTINGTCKLYMNTMTSFSVWGEHEHRAF